MMKPIIAGLVFLPILLGGLSLFAAVPAQMSYQGALTDANGVAVQDGNYTLTFRIYQVESGGTPIWSESHLIPVVGGVFGVVLGSVTPLALPFDCTYYLGISVGSGAEMTPRRKLTAAAYSLNTRAIDDGVAVKSLNGLKDNVSLVGGSNVTIAQANNTLTISATTGSGSGDGNTLDEAYDEGGAGAGRQIVADAGAVHIKGTGGLCVDGKLGVGVTTPEVPVDARAAAVYTIYGETTSGEDAVAGVCGAINNASPGAGGSGVLGIAVDQTAQTNGVWGDHASIGLGVFGTALDGFGVAGLAYGTDTENVGVYGESKATGVGWAGYFYGDVAIAGQIYSSSGSAMLIDHPADPENRYLWHSSVYSPDMLTLYDGVVTLDAAGTAVVELPEYFEELNRDFRYQLTPIGAPAPNLYVSREVEGNRFEVAGGVPGMKVCWTVTGVRHDPQAQQTDRTVERQKPAREKGTFFAPGAYGRDRSASALHAAHPRLLEQIQTRIRVDRARSREE